VAIETRPIQSIKVGDRVRQDLGDLNALAESITNNGGLLQPILIKSDGMLIAGERRLAACKSIGREHVEVNVRNDFTSATAVLIAERDENTCRKDFTPSEAVALGRRLEELERPAAAERQKVLGRTHGNPSGESPEGFQGDTRDKVGAVVGMGGKKYEHAKRVVEAAEEGDQVAAEAIKEMDRTGNVNGAYRKVFGSPSSGLETKTDSIGREQPAIRFGKGDKWQEATEPLSRYLASWAKRGYEFAHVNPTKATKRVERIDNLIAGLEAARTDLEPRTQKAKLTL
jgi:hypothetical protein